MKTPRAVVIGTGSYLPETVLTNDALARRGVNTNDAWIYGRTGIRQRYIAAEGELTSDLATHAARQALQSAGIAVSPSPAKLGETLLELLK